MANFVTCWLQDPGELPPGDGPPGGGGTGNGDDDDDDDGCTGTIEWLHCIPPIDIPTQLAGNLCTGSYTEQDKCDGTQDDCIVIGGCPACPDGDTAACEICCEEPPTWCDGYQCQGDGNSTMDVPCTLVPNFNNDIAMYQGKDCDKGPLFGCEDWTQCGDIYKSREACKAADKAGDKNCEGWVTGDTVPQRPPGGGPPTTSPPGGDPPPCYKCPMTPSYSCCVFETDAVWNNSASKYECPPNGGELDIADCNASCDTLCIECNAEMGTCDETTVPCTTGCTYAGDKAAQQAACESDTNTNCGAPPEDTYDCYIGVGYSKCDLDGTPNDNGICFCNYRTYNCDINPDGDGAYSDSLCGDGCPCPSEPDKDCVLVINCPGEDDKGGGEGPGDIDLGHPGEPPGGPKSNLDDGGTGCKDLPVWFCNTDTTTCDTSSMSDTHTCFATLFNQNDCTPNDVTGGCTDTGTGITWYNEQADCIADGCEDTGDDCPDFVICSESVCPAIVSTWRAHPNHTNCGIDDPIPNSSWCYQGWNGYNKCTYGKDVTTGWACEDPANPGSYANTCEDIYGDGTDTIIADLYNDPSKNLKENGIWACNGRWNSTNPDDDYACNNVRTDKCGPGCASTAEGNDGNGGIGYAIYGGKKAHERIYGSPKSSPILQKSISNQLVKNPTEFIGVSRGTLPGNIFKDIVHVGIKSTDEIINKRISFSDRPFSDLSNSNLERSLQPFVLEKINLARSATGRSLKPMFLNTLRALLVTNTLDTFNLPDFIGMLNQIIQVQDTDEYRDSRSYVPIRNLNTVGNEAAAIEFATDKIWPLDPNKYLEDGVRERMRTWKTLAPDLEKGLPVTTSTGATTTLYYDINDQLTLASSGTLTMSNGDLQEVTLGDGTKVEIPVQSLIEHAGILSLEDIQKVMYLLGTEYNFEMTVTTDPSARVDETYSLSGEREQFYMLTLETSTIEDLERDNSFVRRTKASYKYETNKAARNKWLNTANKGAAIPFLEVNLNYQDPIFNYIEEGGSIEITSKDFSLDVFNDSQIPVTPRRQIQTLVIYPSDVTSKVVTHSISKSDSYGARTITIEINPNPNVSDNWDPAFLSTSVAWPGKGINPTVENTRAIQYSIDTEGIHNNLLYEPGTQTTPRKAFGVRQVLKLAQEIKENYYLPSDNALYWYEIYERMDITMMKYLHRECKNFTKFKSLLNSGNISTDPEVNKLYPKLKEFRSVDWLGTDPIVQKPDLSYVLLRPGKDEIPVEPL
jgi:hypothetical protein